MIDTTWVILRRYPTVIHAELAKSALQAYGVDAAVLGGPLDERPDFLDRSIDLMVKREDVNARSRFSAPRNDFHSEGDNVSIPIEQEGMSR